MKLDPGSPVPLGAELCRLEQAGPSVWSCHVPRARVRWVQNLPCFGLTWARPQLNTLWSFAQPRGWCVPTWREPSTHPVQARVAPCPCPEQPDLVGGVSSRGRAGVSRLAGFWSSPSFFLAFGSAKPRGLGGIEPGPGPPLTGLPPTTQQFRQRRGPSPALPLIFRKQTHESCAKKENWDRIFMVSCIYIKMSWPFTDESPRVASLGCGGEVAVEGTHHFSPSIHVSDDQVQPKLKSQRCWLYIRKRMKVNFYLTPFEKSVPGRTNKYERQAYTYV